MSQLFTQTSFAPVALGFFGLAIGYLVVGGTQVLPVPARRRLSEEKEGALARATGAWMVWMPGFMQFLTGMILMIGLTWFDVFEKSPPLYMASLAFTAYGVHWFAMGYRRWSGASEFPEGFMALGFIVLSILGATVFFIGGRDVPVAILFVLLTIIYLIEAPTKLGFIGKEGGEKAVGWVQVLTGFWLLYLTFAYTVNVTSKAGWWV